MLYAYIICQDTHATLVTLAVTLFTAKSERIFNDDIILLVLINNNKL